MPNRLLLIFAFSVVAAFGQQVTQPGGSGGLTSTTFASPPASPVLNQAYLFSDASAPGACTGGASSYSICAWNGSGWSQSSSSSTGGTGNNASKVAVAYSATPTFTCPSASAGTGNAFLVGQLTGNITSSTIATCTTGQLLSFTFTQCAAGSCTVAMPASFDACPINPVGNSVFSCAYWKDATGAHLVGSSNIDAGNVISGTLAFSRLPVGLSIMSALGDLMYGGASGALTRLAGDTSNTRKLLVTLSVGGVATAPSWGILQSSDIPSNAANTSGTAAGLAAAYIDWNAVSGGTFIQNKPTLGSAAAQNSTAFAPAATFQSGILSAIPSTCTVAEGLYQATNQPPGLQLYACTALNTWTRVGYAQGASNPVSCVVGQVFFNTANTAGQNWEFCTATDTWTQQLNSGGGGGGSVSVNGSSVSNPNFGNAPTADTGYTLATLKTSGSNVSIEFPNINGSTYTSTAITNQSSLTVTEATHGQGLTPVAWCFDTQGTRENNNCNWGVNSSGDVVFAWTPNFSGTVQIGTGGGGNALATTVVSTSGPVTVGVGGYYYNNASGALTYNLPVITSSLIGGRWCFRNLAGQTGVMTLQLPSLTYMDLAGTNGSAAGTLVSPGSLGDSVCVMSVTTTQYVAYIGSGVWTNN